MKISAVTLTSVLLSSLLLSPAMAVTPKPGEVLADNQVLRINIGSAPRSIDPNLALGTPGMSVIRNAFEGLLIYDNDGKPLPGVAESYEHNKDSTVWTFKLRKNAKWSNGEGVTANDFVYSWRRLADPKTASEYSSYLEYMRIKNVEDVIAGKKPPAELGIRALDDYTFEITLSSPVSFLDYMVGFAILSPVPKKVVERYGDQWTKPEHIVSNGAWVVAQNIVNEKIVLKRNPYYWDSKSVILKRVDMLEIVSESNAYSRYRAGDLDVSGYPTEIFEKVKKEYPKELQPVTMTLCTYYYQFNTTAKPFDDRRVREALNMTLERDIITDKILKIGSVPAYTFAPRAINSAGKVKDPFWASESLEKRSKQAKRLLEDAGYSKSNPLTFNLLYNTSEGHKKIAVAAASIWKKNLDGMVKIELVNQEWKTFLDTKKALKYQLSRAGWCADYDDASTFLNILKSDSSNNDTGYKNKEYDELINRAYYSQTEGEREEEFAKAEKVLSDDSVIVPVYFYASRPLIKEYVRGLIPNKNAKYYYKNVYIVKK